MRRRSVKTLIGTLRTITCSRSRISHASSTTATSITRLAYLANTLPEGEATVIYEMRTFNLKPGKLAEFEKRYATALPERTRISPLGACWHTEIGPLNQVIAIWPYDDMA